MSESSTPHTIWQIALPTPVGAGVFTYLVPPDIQAGALVEAPFGRQKLIGIALNPTEGPAELEIPIEKLKSAQILGHYQPLPAELAPFVEWVANYTCTPPGKVWKMVLAGVPEALPPKARAVKAIPAQVPNIPTLNPEQAAALAALQAGGEGYGVTLLDGVTGSGKTEVYCAHLATHLAKGQQVLILVPEIALTSQLVTRLTARFGGPPTLWHSGMTKAQRRSAWQSILSGEAKLIVGARSALFLPYANLGMIIVDEEHDSSYKQTEGVLYHARDMAIVRAKFASIPILLASATPALETYYNAKIGKYTWIKLTQRHGAVVPEIAVVDLKDNPPERGGWLSPEIIQNIADNLAKSEQTLLFLNRRGYAPLVLCRTCGHRYQCPNCSAYLIEHRRREIELSCHHCGYQRPFPMQCDGCAAPASQLASCGPGVERIAAEVAEKFPNARIAVLTSETIAKPEEWQALQNALEQGEIDLLIGTQILAKGHNFPDLTLVVVVDADMALLGAEWRAGEQCFQLLQQVAGRAGRFAKPGRVMVQTTAPDHAVLKALAANDRDQLWELLLTERQQFSMPPFARMANLILSALTEKAVQDAAKQLAKTMPRATGLQILGPAPAPLSRLRGRYRLQFLVKTAAHLRPQAFIQEWLAKVNRSKTVQLQIDIDPV